MPSFAAPTLIDRQDISRQLDYFFDRIPCDLRRVDSLASELQANGNEAFNDGVPDRAIVDVPALLDERQMDRVLDQLSRQDYADGGRPTVIVGGNAGEACSDEGHKNYNLDMLRAFGRIASTLNVPYSFYNAAYKEGVPIGQVRAEKKAAGLRYYQRQMARLGLPPRDILSASSDADLVYMESGYLEKITADFEASPLPAWIGGPVPSHDRLPERFRRVNKLLDWYDLKSIVVKGVAPTQFAISAGCYALVGGIEPTWDAGEVLRLHHKLKEKFEDQEIAVCRADSTVHLSSRQLVYRIASSGAVEYGALRTPVSGQAVDYRNFSLAEDISRLRYYQVLVDFVGQIVMKCIGPNTQAIQSAAGDKEKLAALGQRVTEMVQQLHGIVGELDGSGQVIDIVLERYLSKIISNNVAS